MQVRSITYFRAVAILFIVAGHTLYEAGLPTEALAPGLAWKLLGGGTVFFVFISGFLFHRVFAHRFDYRRFMTGKIENVAKPYLVVSALALTLFLTLGAPITFLNFAEPFAQLGPVDRLARLAYLLGTGGHMVAYWYVPFALIMFALSPLHMAYIRLGPKPQLAILAGFFVLSLLLHKPLLDISKLHAVLYYQSAYLAGILVSQYWTQASATLPRLALPLTLTAVALAAGDVLWGASFGNYFRLLAGPFEGIDWMYLQKMLLAFALFGWLMRLEHRDIPALTALADASFGIFFLHGVLLRLFAVTGLRFDSGSPALDTLALFLLTVGLAWAITRGVQLAAGAQSRQLIGS